MKPILEVACFSPDSARVAVNAGADRIEFCHDYNAGGITPSLEDFSTLRAITRIPIYVMIRPRSGDFIYNASEIAQMENSIVRFKEMGADGFVFGILTQEMAIDVPACKRLIEKTDKLPCTFHRAFDRCSDPIQATKDIISCGFKNILTSGNARTSEEGATLLTRLMNHAGNRIAFIPGGGIRSSNLKSLCKTIPAGCFHSAAIVSGQVANHEEIQKMKAILNACGLGIS